MYLGVDGGGTKTAYALIDAGGRLHATHYAGSVSHLSGGVAAATALLHEGIRTLLAKGNLRPADVSFAYFGLPSYGEDSATTAQLDAMPSSLFDAALDNDFIHLFEHALYLGSALLFWWPVVQPWPNASTWPRWSLVLYLFLATMPCDVLSAFLVFSDRVAYPVYLSGSTYDERAVLGDQQIAGALMWTCVTIVYLVAGTILTTRLLAAPSVHDVLAQSDQRDMVLRKTRRV